MSVPPALFAFGIAWLSVLAGALLVMILRARSLAARILALDTLTLLLVAALVLFADAQNALYYMDAALAVALLSFVATVVAARYLAEGDIFS